MENKDLKFLKKHYGENFAHFCRELFPTILEQEGLLSTIISKHFGPSRSLYNDVIKCRDEFKDYIFSLVDVEQDALQEVVKKTPEELMDEAGYILFPECQTEEEVQAFKKYYKPREVLCTFRGGRLDYCRVWFAVKKNVDEIRREDFPKPTRQDEYGTSVISIQFSRGRNSTLSIKNRYNHTVNNPDATFGNNLDNIIPGLTEAFTETYDISLSGGKNGFELDGYRLGDDGRFYRVNLEFDDICYCENNVVLDHGKVVEFDKLRYIVAENYIIDQKNGTVTLYGEKNEEDDSFIQSLGEIDKISTKKDENGNKVVVIVPKEGEKIELTLNEKNQMIGLNNPNVEEIGDDFLYFNESLKTLSMAKLKKVKGDFMYDNIELETVDLPILEETGNYFLRCNKGLKTLSLPKIKKVGHFFLHQNEDLKIVDLPNLELEGGNFLALNKKLRTLSLPKLRKTGDGFLWTNEVLETVDLPSLEQVEDAFLQYNKGLRTLSLPKLIVASNMFLYHNETLETVDMPSLIEVGNGFLLRNKGLKTLSLPKLKYVGSYFLRNNEVLETVDLPSLEQVRNDFLYWNKSLKSLSLQKLKDAGNYFLEFNSVLEIADLPNLERVGDDFLCINLSLTSLNAPKLENCPEYIQDMLTHPDDITI